MPLILKYPQESLTVRLLRAGVLKETQTKDSGLYIRGHRPMCVMLNCLPPTANAPHHWAVHCHDELAFTGIIEYPALVAFIAATFESTDGFAAEWLHQEILKTYQ